MAKPFKKLALALTALFLAAPVNAAPVLRENIVVDAAIVTIGDMFYNAGNLAEQPLFRAPAPGTTGQVDIAAIRTASAKVGLSGFENPGLFTVSVARSGVAITMSDINALIARDLDQQGFLRPGMSLTARVNQQLGLVYAANVEEPFRLEDLRFVPASNGFSATIMLAGRARALEISGRVEFFVQAPHLTRTLPAGTIVQASDVEMRAVALQFADSAQLAAPGQIIGQQLRRQMRRGVAVSLNDVAPPTLIGRNELVTLYLRNGALTLTVKGQALADASLGQSVSVLNLLSNTVVRGIAVKAGTVEIASASSRVAAL